MKLKLTALLLLATVTVTLGFILPNAPTNQPPASVKATSASPKFTNWVAAPIITRTYETNGPATNQTVHWRRVTINEGVISKVLLDRQRSLMATNALNELRAAEARLRALTNAP